MTPQEIQKQLSEIDNKLTDLEVRGRQLEESIRKGEYSTASYFPCIGDIKLEIADCCFLYVVIYSLLVYL